MHFTPMDMGNGGELEGKKVVLKGPETEEASLLVEENDLGPRDGEEKSWENIQILKKEETESPHTLEII